MLSNKKKVNLTITTLKDIHTKLRVLSHNLWVAFRVYDDNSNEHKAYYYKKVYYRPNVVTAEESHIGNLHYTCLLYTSPSP